MDENCLLMQFPPRVGTDDSSVSGSDSSGSNPSFGDEVEEVEATHHRANSPSAFPEGVGETSARTEDHVDVANNVDPDRPPTPWRNSTAKRTVINGLKDVTSDIHLFIGAYGKSNWKQVNFEQIWKKYGHRYDKSNFRENMKRLLIHFQNSTGDFEAAKSQNWYTSATNVSEAYSLLLALYLHPTHWKTLQQIVDTPESQIKLS